MPRPDINLHRPTNLCPTFNRNMHRIVHVNVHAVPWTISEACHRRIRRSKSHCYQDGSQGWFDVKGDDSTRFICVHTILIHIILSLGCMRNIVTGCLKCHFVWIGQWCTLWVHHDTANLQYLTAGLMKRISQTTHILYEICNQFILQSRNDANWRNGEAEITTESVLLVPGISEAQRKCMYILDLLQPTSGTYPWYLV